MTLLKNLRNNRIFTIIFRSILIVIIITGVLLTAIKDGVFHFNTMLYYTTLSNVFVLIITSLLLFRTIMDFSKLGKSGSSTIYVPLHFVALVDIMITFLVYWTLLVPSDIKLRGSEMIFSYSNLAVHLIVPLLFAFDYYMFSRPKSISYKIIFYTWIFPLCYLVLALILGFSNHKFGTRDDGSIIRFPYFFIDFDEQGYFIILWVMGIIAFFSIVAFLGYIIDKKRIHKYLNQWRSEI